MTTNSKHNLHLLASKVMDYAVENYNRRGWDLVVECHSVNDLVVELEKTGIRTFKGAATHIYHTLVKHQHAYRCEIQSTAF